MLNVRIHLDPCGEGNGPLLVLPGSHRDGKLTTEGVASWIATVPAVACLADKGDILLFRPLLLHSSSPARSPAHRRVLQLEFANRQLPGEVTWNWAV